MPIAGYEYGLSALQDSILVAGYPLGGDSLSITKGIVSRVSQFVDLLAPGTVCWPVLLMNGIS